MKTKEIFPYERIKMMGYSKETINVEIYQQMLEQPWGKIQYKITFAQLQHLENKRILDFGSGFGLVSQFLAGKNQVVSIEPNAEMLYANGDSSYEKMLGSIELLNKFESKSFDIVVCHNVLEYILPEERKSYMAQFKRILKDDGRISVIKHNQVGKVIQSVVFANDIDKALGMLKGERFESASFAHGSTYTIEELLSISELKLENYLAIRTFYSLQPNEFKTQSGWLEAMTGIELAVSDLKPYKDISFLQHLWLKK